MRYTLFLAVVAALLLAALAACGDDDEQPQPSPTPTRSGPADAYAVTTLPIFAEWARIVGGPGVEVSALVPPGRNPHDLPEEDIDFTPLHTASVVLYNALGLEPTIQDRIFTDKRRGSQVVAYSHAIDSPTQPEMSAFLAGDNAHLWLNPSYAYTYLDVTWDSFVIVDGAHLSTYHANARAYQAQIEGLDEEIAQTLEALPADRRLLVTTHDAWEHFARRYSFEVAAVASEMSVTALATLITRRDVPAVFREVGFDNATIEAAAQEAGVEVCTLYSDVLDEDAPTYLEMMRHNATELARCLAIPS